MPFPALLSPAQRAPAAAEVLALALCVLTLVAVLLPAGQRPVLAAPPELVHPVEVSASSHEGEHVPGNTLDADPATRWSAEGDDAWIAYDLGAPRRLGALDIAWYGSDRRTTRFSVEVSRDGESWEAVERAEDDTADLTSDDRHRVAFAAVEARYVRIVASGLTANGFTSITEVTVEAEPAEPAVPSEDAAQVLWSTDFTGEDPLAAIRPEVQVSAGNVSFPSPGHALDGSVLRVRMAAGQRTGHKWRARFHDAPGARGKHLGIGEQDEVHLSYLVFLPADASVGSRDMKLPGIGGLQDHQNGWETATGGDQRSDSWSLRLHTRHPRASHHGRPQPQPFTEAYLYARSAGGKRIADQPYGMSFPLTDPTQTAGAALPLRIGEWNHVQMRVQMNTRGRADGVVEVWLNGVLGVSLDDVRFTDTDDIGVNQLIADTFYNEPGAAQTHDIDLARMRLSSGALPSP